MKPIRPANTYLLRISLRGIPTVWRQVVVPATVRLSRLHDVIQVVMGWSDMHLHEFTDPHGSRYGVPEHNDYEPPLDENDYKLNQFFGRVGDTLRYQYDFGDSWDHLVTLKKITEYPRRPTRAELIDGAGNCPPEDCGGVPGYYEMLKALADPSHPEHDQFTGWLPDGSFDPTRFDPSRAQILLRSYRV